MKFLYLIALFAFLKLVTCDNILIMFDSGSIASNCRGKHYKYINSVAKTSVVLDSVVYLDLKVPCEGNEESIYDTLYEKCGGMKYSRCFTCS
ncbi:unnamed protein product [Cunninghamella blakesleeana]